MHETQIFPQSLLPPPLAAIPALTLPCTRLPKKFATPPEEGDRDRDRDRDREVGEYRRQAERVPAWRANRADGKRT
jgi:hypothetical protein